MKRTNFNGVILNPFLALNHPKHWTPFHFNYYNWTPLFLERVRQKAPTEWLVLEVGRYVHCLGVIVMWAVDFSSGLWIALV